MKTRSITIAVWVLLFGCWLPATGHADTIVLKTGKKLLVEKAWQDGNQVWFFFHGMKASLSKKEVRFIQYDSAADDRQNATRLENDSDRPASDRSLESTFENPSGSRAEQPLPLTTDGLGKLRWGVRASTVAGLEQMIMPSDMPGIKEYRRPADPLQYRDVTLESVVYAFWHDQLYTVTLWTRGLSNYKALRNRVLAEFGPAHHSDKSRTRDLWSTPDTDIMLKYTAADQLGMLWMRCCRLDRQYKLSHISAQSSYLKWMHSRKTAP
jgi:hypothetical protein